MKFFVRAVISGFGYSLGKALFDQVKNRIGLGDEKTTSEPEVMTNNTEDTPQKETPADD